MDDDTCMRHSLTCVDAETVPVYEKIVVEYHEILKKANSIPKMSNVVMASPATSTSNHGSVAYQSQAIKQRGNN